MFSVLCPDRDTCWQDVVCVFIVNNSTTASINYMIHIFLSSFFFLFSSFDCNLSPILQHFECTNLEFTAIYRAVSVNEGEFWVRCCCCLLLLYDRDIRTYLFSYRLLSVNLRDSKMKQKKERSRYGSVV